MKKLRILILILIGGIVFQTLNSLESPKTYVQDTKSEQGQVEILLDEKMDQSTEKTIEKVSELSPLDKPNEIFLSQVSSNEVELIKLQVGDASLLVETKAQAEDIIEESISIILDEEVHVSIEDNIVNINLDKESPLESVELISPFIIETTRTDPEQVLPFDQAVDQITKKTEKPKTYLIQSADVPSRIAINNDMTLKDLYSLNPGLEERASKIQIGEELIVTQVKPELDLQVVETVIYDQPIAKSYDYQNDASLYQGTNKTISYGSDGLKEVEAKVTYVNNMEVSRKVIDETVKLEPINAVIARGTKDLPAKGSLGTFVSPLSDYRLTSEFGPRWNSQHRGIDMAANYGSSVLASDGGLVTYAGWLGSYGYLVEIDHDNGVVTRYGHNSKILVKKGQLVSQYEAIALVGSTGNSTGPHVHFEIIIDGSPVDPYLYLE